MRYNFTNKIDMMHIGACVFGVLGCIIALIVYLVNKKPTEWGKHYLTVNSEPTFDFSDLSTKLNITLDNTIIIGGKAPNLDIFVKNYKLYSNFKKISLNESFYNDKIKYDYMIIGDSDPRKRAPDVAKSGPYKYNKYILSKIDTNYNNMDKTDPNSHMKIITQRAKEKNIKVIVAINKIKTNWNAPVRWAKENNMHDDFINFEAGNNCGVDINKNVFDKSNSAGCTGGTVAHNAIMYSIRKKYKNILLTGISCDNGPHIKPQYIKLMKQIKKYYPDVNLICLYPNENTKNIFHYDINE